MTPSLEKPSLNHQEIFNKIVQNGGEVEVDTPEEDLSIVTITEKKKSGLPALNPRQHGFFPGLMHQMINEVFPAEGSEILPFVEEYFKFSIYSDDQDEVRMQ